MGKCLKYITAGVSFPSQPENWLANDGKTTRWCFNGVGNQDAMPVLKNPKIYIAREAKMPISRLLRLLGRQTDSARMANRRVSSSSVRGAALKTTIFALLLAVALSACVPAITAAPKAMPIAPTQTMAAAVEVEAALNTSPSPTVTPPPYEDLTRLFDYDRTTVADIHEVSVTDLNGIQVHDISYESPKGGWVTAFLVTPPGTGSFAGIIFLHPGGGDRSWFLDEAKKLATLGVVSLLLDDNFSAKGKPTDRDRIIRIIVDVRRGVDLLTARSDVDPQRIGFVGHSYGANLGGVLAGVEHRIAAYVFMSGNARMSQDLIGLFNMSHEQEAQYLGFMSQLDGIHFIGHATPAALLFQNARHDALNSEQEVLDFQQAASEPKLVKWYDAYHQLNDEAEQDRAEWLSKQLKLKAMPQPGDRVGTGASPMSGTYSS
jgi:dienelactone hydrolase